MVSGSETGEILCWDLVEGRIIERLQGAHGTKPVSSIDVFSSKSAPSSIGRLVSAGFDGNAIVWEEAIKSDEIE